MSSEQNLRALAAGRRICETRDFERFDEMFAEDVIDHDGSRGQAPGIEGIKEYWRSLERAFPDFELEIDVLEGTDDYVMLANRVRGTHTGEFLGCAATGRHFEVRSLQLCRFENGRCVERWGSTDMLGLLAQLGLAGNGEPLARRLA